jgi:hypothetical protein
VRREFEPILELAKTIPVEEVAHFLADLEEIRVTALGVLMRPVPAPPDRLIDIHELSARIGVGVDCIYRNKKRYAAFARPQGKKLLWSSSGLDAYLKKSK